MNGDDEEELLRSVALQNAKGVLLARQRAEQELIRTKETLEARTEELAKSLALMEATLRERDRARAEADEATRAAQGANEAKGRFLRMVSHELRTPLGAIGGYAALLDEGIYGPISGEQHECIARIRHNQKHLLGLVNQLLDFARIDSGRLDLNLGPVRIQGALANVLVMIEPQVAAKGLRLDVSRVDLSILLHADRDRVEQIILNLLSNATKFTSTGGTITIETVQDTDKVEVRVTDSGIGISREKLEAVFEPFMQVSPALSAVGGTGLGLSISRQLARAMEGDITAESVPGTGSTFTLCLPRGFPDSPEDHTVSR